MEIIGNIFLVADSNTDRWFDTDFDFQEFHYDMGRMEWMYSCLHLKMLTVCKQRSSNNAPPPKKKENIWIFSIIKLFQNCQYIFKIQKIDIGSLIGIGD
jgi:hypothetical protein